MWIGREGFGAVSGDEPDIEAFVEGLEEVLERVVGETEPRTPAERETAGGVLRSSDARLPGWAAPTPHSEREPRASRNRRRTDAFVDLTISQ